MVTGRINRHRLNNGEGCGRTMSLKGQPQALMDYQHYVAQYIKQLDK
jgi:hypothetical protein